MVTHHKHHIIPKHAGGSDDPDNIITLTVSEHASAHLDLYEKYGKIEDLCAYHMLSGNMEQFRSEYGRLGGTACQKKRDEDGMSILGGSWDEFYKNHSTYAAMGGRVQGQRNAETGHIQRIAREQSHEDHVANGRLGAERCRELGVNAFFDPILKLKISSMGGKVQGPRNAESGHLSRISAQYWADVRAGVKSRPKKIWVFSEELKISMKILATDEIPEGFARGRKINW